MRFQWEASDVRAGRRVVAQTGGKTPEQYIIGYDAAVDSVASVTLTSLADGSLVCQRLTKQELATTLNDRNHAPLTLDGPT